MYLTDICLMAKPKCIYRRVGWANDGNKVATVVSYLGEVLHCSDTHCDLRLITGREVSALRREVELISQQHYDRLAEMWERSERKQSMSHTDYSNKLHYDGKKNYGTLPQLHYDGYRSIIKN